jgi:hypothetical protein
MGKENNNRKIVNSEPLVERAEEPRTSGENPQNKYRLRSDSESGEEVSKPWEALHNANTRHHLHQHPELETQGQAISNDDVEINSWSKR